MEKIAKRFGLQLYEEFEIAEKPYCKFRFSKTTLEGLFLGQVWLSSLENLYDLLTHRYHIESLTEFAEGDRYYISCPTCIEMWDYDTWSEREVDYYRFEHGFVFKTREEATAVAVEMLNSLPKEER